MAATLLQESSSPLPLLRAATPSHPCSRVLRKPRRKAVRKNRRFSGPCSTATYIIAAPVLLLSGPSLHESLIGVRLWKRLKRPFDGSPAEFVWTPTPKEPSLILPLA